MAAMIILGRFLFFALLILQSFFLASYPAKYEHNGSWYAVSILFIPAAVLWWWMNGNDGGETDSDRERGLLLFSVAYVWLGLVPMIGIVFGLTGDKIESEGFWNPSTLKLTLCITPLLLLLVFHTKIVLRDLDFRQVTECSVKITINLYDGIELLGVIVLETECSHGIPKHFKNGLIALSCISYLWLPFVMAVDWNAFGDNRNDELWVVYYAIQAVFEMIFLGIRWGLSLRYGITTSIFISKNIVMLIVYVREIINHIFPSNSVASSANQQRNEDSEASTPAPPVRDTDAPLPTVTTVLPIRSPSVAPAPTAPPPFNPYI